MEAVELEPGELHTVMRDGDVGREMVGASRVRDQWPIGVNEWAREGYIYDEQDIPCYFEL